MLRPFISKVAAIAARSRLRCIRWATFWRAREGCYATVLIAREAAVQVSRYKSSRFYYFSTNSTTWRWYEFLLQRVLVTCSSRKRTSPWKAPQRHTMTPRPWANEQWSGNSVETAEGKRRRAFTNQIGTVVWFVLTFFDQPGSNVRPLAGSCV